MTGPGRTAELTVLLLLSVASLAAAAASLTAHAPSAAVSTGIERGVAQIRCAPREIPQWRRMRAIVLDLGTTGAAGEVLVAPAHGLPENPDHIQQDCTVVGADQRVSIAAVWLSEHRGEHRGGDWAVLVTRVPLAGEVGRLRAGVLSRDDFVALVAEQVPVRLMLYSQSMEQDDCTMLDVGRQSTHWMPLGVFMHSCRSWPGVSGAPIVALRNGERLVIGFNLGRTVRPLHFDGPLFLSVGRIVDGEIAQAIEQAAGRVLAARQ